MKFEYLCKVALCSILSYFVGSFFEETYVRLAIKNAENSIKKFIKKEVLANNITSKEQYLQLERRPYFIKGINSIVFKNFGRRMKLVFSSIFFLFYAGIFYYLDKQNSKTIPIINPGIFFVISPIPLNYDIYTRPGKSTLYHLRTKCNLPLENDMGNL